VNKNGVETPLTLVESLNLTLTVNLSLKSDYLIGMLFQLLSRNMLLSEFTFALLYIAIISDAIRGKTKKK